MIKREKLHIRLPGDDAHGPNPYDSRTPLRDLSPRWLWDSKWWVSIAAISVAMVLARYWTGTL